MSKIIILEGQDRCGKSTLTKQLSDTYGPGVICHHSSSPPKLSSKELQLNWELVHYQRLMEQFSYLSHKGIVIADRLHLGAVVYGKKFRGYENVSTDMFEHGWPENVYLFTLMDASSELMKRSDGLSFEKTAEEFTATRQSFIMAHDQSTIKNKCLINITNIGGFDGLYDLVCDVIEGC